MAVAQSLHRISAEWSIELDRPGRPFVNAYAKSRIIPQYDDGSCDYKKVGISCDSQPDPWTGKYEIEFSGRPRSVEKVCKDFVELTGVKGKVVKGVGFITDASILSLL